MDPPEGVAGGLESAESKCSTLRERPAALVAMGMDAIGWVLPWVCGMGPTPWQGNDTFRGEGEPGLGGQTPSRPPFLGT